MEIRYVRRSEISFTNLAKLKTPHGGALIRLPLAVGKAVSARGERFFHLTDPDGHELSFARPLR